MCCLESTLGANGCEYTTRIRRDMLGNPYIDGEDSTNKPVDVNFKYKVHEEGQV